MPKQTGFWMSRVLNMTKFRIRKVLSMTGVSIYKRYLASWICQNMPCRVLNISWVLNMPGFWIWQGSEYLKVAQGSKYTPSWIYLNRTWVCLNMSGFFIIDRILNMYHIINSARSFYKFVGSYWDIGVFRNRNPL